MCGANAPFAFTRAAIVAIAIAARSVAKKPARSVSVAFVDVIVGPMRAAMTIEMQNVPGGLAVVQNVAWGIILQKS